MLVASITIAMAVKNHRPAKLVRATGIEDAWVMVVKFFPSFLTQS
jgi:hypothetical protein